MAADADWCEREVPGEIGDLLHSQEPGNWPDAGPC